MGVSTGFGGESAAFLMDQHYRRFLIGADPRNTNLLWDQMFRASMFYGRKGLALAAISVVDLARCPYPSARPQELAAYEKMLNF